MCFAAETNRDRIHRQHPSSNIRRYAHIIECSGIFLILPLYTDYFIGQSQLAFTSSLQQTQISCGTITAISDDRLEGDEILAFTLQSSAPEVSIGLMSVTMVTITDETGQYSQ